MAGLSADWPRGGPVNGKALHGEVSFNPDSSSPINFSGGRPWSLDPDLSGAWLKYGMLAGSYFAVAIKEKIARHSFPRLLGHDGWLVAGIDPSKRWPDVTVHISALLVGNCFAVALHKESPT